MIKRIIPEPYLTYSRQLRKTHNLWEIKLWQQLRVNRFYGLPFKRQVQIGLYIFDFACRSKMLIIELDGGQHSEGAVIERDKQKQRFAESQGYKVLRFWNNDIDRNIEGVLEIIKKGCGL